MRCSRLRLSTSSPLSSAEQPDNLARLRVTPKLRFLEDWRTVA
jgi:hypothetical protein